MKNFNFGIQQVLLSFYLRAHSLAHPSHYTQQEEARRHFQFFHLFISLARSPNPSEIFLFSMLLQNCCQISVIIKQRSHFLQLYNIFLSRKNTFTQGHLGFQYHLLWCLLGFPTLLEALQISTCHLIPNPMPCFKQLQLHKILRTKIF